MKETAINKVIQDAQEQTVKKCLRKIYALCFEKDIDNEDFQMQLVLMLGWLLEKKETREKMEFDFDKMWKRIRPKGGFGMDNTTDNACKKAVKLCYTDVLESLLKSGYHV